MKPIKVHIVPPGPNPWKVVLVLEELEILYDLKAFAFEKVKSEPFISINPNGRVPAIEDPNTGVVLWESGAIIQYLVEQYDDAKTLSYTDLKQRHQLNQWLMFQVSGQGPYFGQAGWFNVLHHETLPSAIERYSNEVKRVLSVLDGVLTNRKWLVGDKMTYADLSFTLWNDRLDAVLMCKPEDKFQGFKNVQAWHERMTSRPAWQRTMAERAELMKEFGLQWNGMPKGVNTVEEYMAMVQEASAKAAKGE